MKAANLVAKFSAILLLLLFIILWVIDYSSFEIPERIKGANISIYGLVVLAAFSIILYLFQKTLLRRHPSMAVAKLVWLSILVSAPAEIIYQGIRHFGILSDKSYRSFFVGFIASIVIAALIGLLVSLELKKTKRYISVIVSILILVMFFIIGNMDYQLEW